MQTPNTEMQALFCEFYLAGHTQTEAARLAGFSEATAKEKGCELRKRFEEYLAAETIANLRGGGSLAFQVLLQLAQTAKQDSVKLKAATELLKFGGYEPVQRQEIKIEQRTDEEIDAQLASLLGADKAKAMGIVH